MATGINLIVLAVQEVLLGQQEVPWLRQPGFKEFQEVIVLCGMDRRMWHVCYSARAGDGLWATQRNVPLKIMCLRLMHVCHWPGTATHGYRPDISLHRCALSD